MNNTNSLNWLDLSELLGEIKTLQCPECYSPVVYISAFVTNTTLGDIPSVSNVYHFSCGAEQKIQITVLDNEGMYFAQEETSALCRTNNEILQITVEEFLNSKSSFEDIFELLSEEQRNNLFSNLKEMIKNEE